ncbi:unnamed protein product, partial [Prorocentrum cordatum]
MRKTKIEENTGRSRSRQRRRRGGGEWRMNRKMDNKMRKEEELPQQQCSGAPTITRRCNITVSVDNVEMFKRDLPPLNVDVDLDDLAVANGDKDWPVLILVLLRNHREKLAADLATRVRVAHEIVIEF